MAVIKSKRSESGMEFVHTARQLQIYTIQKVVNFPKRYTFYVSQPIANAATRIHECAKMANSIYPLNQHEAQMRRDYLLRANAELNSLASQLEIAQQFDAYRTVQSMGKLYNDLFVKDWLIPA